MSQVVKIQKFIVNDISLAQEICKEIGWQFSEKGSIYGGTKADFYMTSDTGYTYGLKKIKDTESYNILCEDIHMNKCNREFVFNYNRKFIENDQRLKGRSVTVQAEDENYLELKVTVN
jgi:hypothetical protein